MAGFGIDFTQLKAAADIKFASDSAKEQRKSRRAASLANKIAVALAKRGLAYQVAAKPVTHFRRRP